jgi:DNA modification methylase
MIPNTIYGGDCIETMCAWPDACVQTCVTSPPYYGLRDYGHDGQIGLEETPEAYVAKMVEVFREVRRVLADDGTLWLNLGDSYWGGGWRGASLSDKSGDLQKNHIGTHCGESLKSIGTGKHEFYKPKDLIGIPWMVAFALRADGWYLRQDIIWHKPNPMPESVTNRCTKAHEYIFLLAKSQRYYYDHEAVKEPATESSMSRLAQPALTHQEGSTRVPGKTNGNMKAVGGASRNRRSVWTVTTKPYKGAHFATFPADLIAPCIQAGAPEGGIVLDPFMGSGTTAHTALRLGRRYVGCELNGEYIKLANKRLEQPFLI